MDHMEKVFYLTSIQNTIDIVLLSNVHTAYPLHTHAEHHTVGIVIAGKIIVETNVGKIVCEADDIFVVPMDKAHSIEPFCDSSYTMLSFCIHHDCFARTDIDNIKSMIDTKLKQLFDGKESISC